MFLHVVDCEYVSGYILKVSFNTGQEVEVDLQEELYGEIFEPLKKLEYFKKFKISDDTFTVEWDNGADFAPEFLLETGKVLV